MAYQSEIEKLQKQWMANPEQAFAPYAEALRKGGELDLAIDVVKAGLAKRPNYLSAHIVLGRCLVDQKNDPEATKQFEHVLELDAENIIALRFLSELTERAGDIPGAQRWLKRLLDVDPMNEDAVASLQRLEQAGPAPESPVAETPPEEPAAAPVVGAVEGFETTAMESAAPEPSPPAEPVAETDDFRIEQASSPFDTPEPAGARVSGLQLEPTEVSFTEDGGVQAGGQLDVTEPQPEVILDDVAPVTAELPAVEEMPVAIEPPASFEPPVLTLEDSPPPAEPPAPPGLEPVAEFALEPDLPAAAPAPRTSGALRPAQDLPLIMPDEPDGVAPEQVIAPPPRRSASIPAPVTGPAPETLEPEPVITETMAEVYLKQGLVAEARDVYRKLVQARPNDVALREKLTALERQPAAPARTTQPPAAPARRMSVAVTGGVSARSFFGKVLTAKPGTPAPPPPPPAPPAVPAVPAPADEVTTMETAFADDPVSAPGAPTRPTSDELSLASVFGEEIPAAPARPAPSTPGSTPASASGNSAFSFDEFFGGKKSPEAAPAPASEPSAAEGDTGSPDDFLSWLKGLKS